MRVATDAMVPEQVVGHSTPTGPGSFPHPRHWAGTRGCALASMGTQPPASQACLCSLCLSFGHGTGFS